MPGLDKTVILNLAQAGWVAAHHSVLISGPTGAGKSFLASRLRVRVLYKGCTATGRGSGRDESPRRAPVRTRVQICRVDQPLLAFTPTPMGVTLSSRSWSL
jgi:hypothetical protein